MTKRIVLVVVGLALCAGRVEAQEQSRSERFFAGVGFEGVGVATEGRDDAETGQGVGLVVGYGFTPHLALYTQLSATSVNAAGDESYGLAHVDLGLRAHFRAPSKTVVPFVQVGLSSRAFREEFEVGTVEANGTGVALGAGLNAHFTPALAFSTSATWSVGNLGNVKFDGQTIPSESLRFTTARVHVGIVWFPQAPH